MRIEIFFKFMILLFVVSCASPISKFQILPYHTQAPASVQLKNESQKADRFLWDFEMVLHQMFETEHRYMFSQGITS